QSDLVAPDLASLPDLAVALDLMSVPDLAVALDLMSAPDLAVAPSCRDGCVVPTIAFAMPILVPAGHNPESVDAADLDEDGVLDLAVADNGGNEASVLLGRGDGTFKPRVAYATATTPKSVVARDFDRDGHVDLALAAFNGGVDSVFLGAGDGTFHVRHDS